MIKCKIALFILLVCPVWANIKIVEKGNGVVGIKSNYGNATGFILKHNERYFLISNNHVWNYACINTKKFQFGTTIYTDSYLNALDYTIFGSDDRNLYDIGGFELPFTPEVSLSLASFEKKEGTKILIDGFETFSLKPFQCTATMKTMEQSRLNMFQSSIGTLKEGASGSPVLNMNGKVLGIFSSSDCDGTLNQNWFTNSNYIRLILDRYCALHKK